jgi:hypothetical protein
VQALGQAHSILSLVSIGLGLAIVPRDASNASFDNVTFRPITVAPWATVDLHAAVAVGQPQPCHFRRSSHCWKT